MTKLYGNDSHIARVRLSTGRVYLEVAGYMVAVQGDPVRDPDLDGRVWDVEKLEKVARAINENSIKIAASHK